MLISIHIPKTAGTSFGALLQQAYGARLLPDYADHPLASPALPRLARACAGRLGAQRRLQGHDAVHGHFLALKYAHVPGDMVTWLRHPAQRVVSRYEHYRRDVDQNRPLHAVAGLRPGLSLEAFSLIPRYRDTCAKYLRWVPWSRIACFGFSEDMDEGLARMRRVLGLELGPQPGPQLDGLQAAGIALDGPPVISLPRINANPGKASRDYALEPAVERALLALNAQDYRLWCWAREREGV